LKYALLIFVGVGAMIDFSPLLAQPKMVLLGAAGISAFPMAGRIAAKLAQEEDPDNFILMHAMGANTAGQLGSVIAGGILLSVVSKMLRL
jgi:Na+-transporting methylmalonyl-CoA/oxaloacetate decarboxylase beta subunit